jgi:4-amino-4-deoxy-L-arabinose transferase-like glycosyltransferase
LSLGLAGLFLLAGAVRLYRLEAPGVLIDREYTTAIIARDFYFQSRAPVDDWRKAIAHTTRLNQPILEPPITEYLMSLMFRAVGSEQPSLGRLLTSSFWLIGGIFLYKLARAYASTEAAVAATAYYLLVPPGILLSRSLQPDSLMMMLFLLSLLLIVRYYQQPSYAGVVGAAGTTGLTLLYRPLVLFALLGAFIALAIDQAGFSPRLLNRRFFVFICLGLLPVVAYYGYAIFLAGFMHWKIETSFRPDLLLHREFWEGWFELALGGVGATALIAALLGSPLLPRRQARPLVIGLGAGYVAFGLVFTMHIHTHSYYQAQLIPIVALALAPLISLIAQRFSQLSVKWYGWLAVSGAALVLLVAGVREVRQALAADRRLERTRIAQQIGDIVHHSSQTVYLARYYGMPLQYTGELTGAYWPRAISYWLYRSPDERELSVAERLDALGFSPDYFVITDFAEYGAHHADLKNYLERNCSWLAATDEYLIYAQCAGRDASG